MSTEGSRRSGAWSGVRSNPQLPLQCRVFSRGAGVSASSASVFEDEVAVTSEVHDE
jgi:hypothetical protein